MTKHDRKKGFTFNSSLKDTLLFKEALFDQFVFQFLIKGYDTKALEWFLAIQIAFNSSLKDTWLALEQELTKQSHFQFLIKGYEIRRKKSAKCY